MSSQLQDHRTVSCLEQNALHSRVAFYEVYLFHGVYAPCIYSHGGCDAQTIPVFEVVFL